MPPFCPRTPNTPAAFVCGSAAQLAVCPTNQPMTFEERKAEEADAGSWDLLCLRGSPAWCDGGASASGARGDSGSPGCLFCALAQAVCWRFRSRSSRLMEKQPIWAELSPGRVGHIWLVGGRRSNVQHVCLSLNGPLPPPTAQITPANGCLIDVASRLGTDVGGATCSAL